jgi:RNA recognition motif
MAAKRNDRRFAKLRKERARAERAAAKRVRKEARTTAPTDGHEDPDLAGIVVGPQPKDEASDAEVQAAIERAMSPGTQGTRARRGVATSARLFVGNLDYGADENELRAVFVTAGFAVQDASVVLDRETGRSRGFAFVELADAAQAATAIEKLDGRELHGRELRINSADERR